MASVRFLLRSEKKKDSEVTIYALLRDTHTNIKVSTTISIPFKHWDKKTGAVRPYGREASETKKRLSRVESELLGVKTELLNLIDVSPEIGAKEVKEHIVKYLDNIRSEKSDVPKDMNKYISFLIEQMKSGDRKVRDKRYSAGSIKAWNSFQKTWNAFQKDYIKRTLDFSNIDMLVYSKFVDYCYNKPYTADTTRKYITSLKAVLSYAVKDNISVNRIYERADFSKKVKTASGKRPYLTEKEIDSIYNLELTDPMLMKVRDIFLIGCYTGQRVSDYSRIEREDIIQLPNGSKAINITQQKTGERVIIPFLNDNIEKILERWNYELPHVVDVLINRHIKTICEAAKITEPFMTEVMRGGELIKEVKPKCELITTHTARRSAITNLYKRGVLDTKELRSISGHRTEKSFETYICLSEDEMAEKISNKINNLK